MSTRLQSRAALRRKLGRSFVAAAVAGTPALVARAVDRYWVPVSGNFNSTANWSTTQGGAGGASVPVAGDNANFLFNDSLARSATYVYPGFTGTFNNVTVDNAGATGSTTLIQNQDVLGAQVEVFGQSGSGNYTAGGGVNNVAAGMTLGVNAGSRGVLQLSGTAAVNFTSTNATAMNVGGSGSGTVTQSGGTVNVNAANSSYVTGIYLGSNNGGSGVYNLQGGSINLPNSNSNEFVGYGIGSTGVFNQSGGTNSVGTLTLGQLGAAGSTPAANGTYALSGGTLNTAEDILGFNGNGVFNQTGGTHVVSQAIIIGDNASNSSAPNSSGVYNLQAGTFSAPLEYVGVGGVGTINQSGGTHTISNSLYLGIAVGNNNSPGFYNLVNGTLICGNIEIIGYGNAGTFRQTNGVNTTPTLQIAFGSATASGTYVLSGGALNVSSSEYVGVQGNGVLTQSGGSNTVTVAAGNFYVGFSTAGTGTYNLQGGSLSVNGFNAAEFVGIGGGAGTVNQSAGTNYAYSLFLGFNSSAGSNPAGNGTYNLVNGSLSANSESVGDGGNATFSQSNGSHVVTNDLNVGNLASVPASPTSGTYNLSGGNLSVAGNQIIGNAGVGTFNQSGGFNNPTTLYLGLGAGATGTYNLSSGTLAVNGSETVGSSGAGSFVQSGGFHSVGGSLTVEQSNSAFGEYQLQAGTLSAATIVNNGTFLQTGGAISGNFNNASYYSFSGPSSFSGNLVQTPSGNLNVSSNFSATSVTNAGTISITANVAVQATTFDNEGGAVNLYNGTLAATGALINNGFINGYGTLNGSGAFTNFGTLQQGSGNLTLAVASQTNAGTINLTTGRQLVLNTGLANSGSLNLNGGFVSGTAALVNASTGVIIGPGTISAPIGVNAGSIVVPVGSLNVTRPMTNAGAIQLTGVGASLFGGAITNTGTIQGVGAVGSPLDNQGSVEAIGGTLSLTGVVQNEPTGLIRSSLGNKVLATQGLTNNLGTISLTGGTYDNNNKPLTNTGSISGYGTLSTGGLTNAAGAQLLVANGSMTVNGPLTNAAGGTVSVNYAPALFTGAVVNNGRFKITGTTVSYAAAFTNNGLYASDPATTHFTTLTTGAGGALVGGAGDKFYVSGDFNSASTQAAEWDTADGAELHFEGSGGSHVVTLTGADLGATAAGYRDNFAWGRVVVDAGESLKLADGNAAPGGALYAKSLVLAGAPTDPAALAAFIAAHVVNADAANPLDVYYDPASPADAYLNGGTYALGNGGTASPAAVPEPTTIALLAAAFAYPLRRRRRTAGDGAPS